MNSLGVVKGLGSQGGQLEGPRAPNQYGRGGRRSKGKLLEEGILDQDQISEVFPGLEVGEEGEVLMFEYF